MGRPNFQFTYNVDMVFLIDATGSMGNVIDMVKDNALNFYNDLCAEMIKKNKHVSQLRVRVVAFRDYVADGDEAMLVTDFFNLPEMAEDFERCVRSLTAKGGGDEPEDGLEGLAYAMKSKWSLPDNKTTKARHVIVVWSDASTHELGFAKDEPNYPKNMAKDIGELTAWWGDKQNPGCMDQKSKRLLLYTPEENGWSYISDNWDNVIHFPSTAGEGLEEHDYSEIINTIACSI